MLKFSGPVNHSGRSATTFIPSEVLSLDHATKRQFLCEKVEFFVHGAGMKNIMHSSALVFNFSHSCDFPLHPHPEQEFL
jgi:hypothetical protein